MGSLASDSRPHTDPTQPQHGRRRHRQEDLRHLRLGCQGRARPLLPWRHHVRHGLQHHQEGLRRTGMPRASSTSSSLETSCTPWATTPPRRSASDWDAKGELDLFFLGDIMYAMGYNTTKKVCVGPGQTDEEGKKFAKFDDVVSKVEEALKTPDSQGTYADYVELLKLYDKNQNGTMMLAELDNILCNLGDEIPKEDVQKMFAEICDPEDEDGLFPYMSFLDRLTGKA